MLKRINDFLAGIPMTIVGGVFLVLSLVLPLMDIAATIDPAWMTVIICGLPLLYLALWRIVHNKGISKISSALLWQRNTRNPAAENSNKQKKKAHRNLLQDFGEPSLFHGLACLECLIIVSMTS